ncbi:hypothetical protein H9P43_003495 [Blastocladiella emersonii ATCC 22665]|nr:hypothetical protein H9P43_003495 [Blastocladiella emersonii ATCC 22665]
MPASNVTSSNGTVSSGCQFYYDNGTLLNGTYQATCDRIPNNGGTIAGIVFGSIFGVCALVFCCKGLFSGLRQWMVSREHGGNTITPSNAEDGAVHAPSTMASSALMRAKNYGPPKQVTYEGSFASPVHRASSDAAARGRKFINTTPAILFNPTPEALDAMVNPAAWALALPFKDMAPFVGVAPEDGAVYFFPNSLTRMSADSDLTLVSNLPVPWLTPAHAQPPPPILYFEVTVVAMAPQTTLAIGLATVPYPFFRLPGWHDWSVGYHSDDGRVFCNDGNGDAYGKPYRVDDVIGVGLRTNGGTCFFTRNGVVLPTVEGPRAPCPETAVHIAVGADGPCAVRLNCGQLPFRCAQFNAVPEQGVRGAGYAVERLPTYAAMAMPQPSSSPAPSPSYTAFMTMPQPPSSPGSASTFATMSVPQPSTSAAPPYSIISMPQPAPYDASTADTKLPHAKS